MKQAIVFIQSRLKFKRIPESILESRTEIDSCDDRLSSNYLRKLLIRILQLSLVLNIGILSQNVMASDDDDDDEPTEDIVLRGDRTCTGCHDEGAESVLAIGKTKHGTVADERAPTCTSCHGKSIRHMDRPERVPMPSRTFGKNSKNPVEDRNKACLSCYQGGKQMHWVSSTHATS